MQTSYAPLGSGAPPTQNPTREPLSRWSPDSRPGHHTHCLRSPSPRCRALRLMHSTTCRLHTTDGFPRWSGHPPSFGHEAQDYAGVLPGGAHPASLPARQPHEDSGLGAAGIGRSIVDPLGDSSPHSGSDTPPVCPPPLPGRRPPLRRRRRWRRLLSISLAYAASLILLMSSFHLGGHPVSAPEYQRPTTRSSKRRSRQELLSGLFLGVNIEIC